MTASMGVQPSSTGLLTAVKTFDAGALRKQLVRDDLNGHYRKSREAALLINKTESKWRQELLAWLRDHVHNSIPHWYYSFVLGHDLHISTFGELHIQHYHANQPDPFTGRMGWLENIGLVSVGKVTTAFRDFEAGALVTDTTAYGDFKHHEVGTANTAEANSQTALTTSSGIARVAGTQTNPSASTYQSVATVTADAGETWQEHGIFNASTSGTMLDRSVLSPTAVVEISDQVTFTYTLTKNAES